MGRRPLKPAGGTAVPDGEDVLKAHGRGHGGEARPARAGAHGGVMPHGGAGGRASDRPVVPIGHAHPRPDKQG